jgi:glucuronate isomerase
MEFLDDDFLLHSQTARNLYHQYAADAPILDYHSHLPPADIANDRRFANLYEPWLEGDHYKWRAMRANGIAERFCTGDAAPYDKFQAWARTVPATVRNPLYQWTHLELRRYFGINERLDEGSAKQIWDRANHALQTEDLSAQGILKKFRVRIQCTTDDPCDDLTPHQRVNGAALGFRMYPTFRPDKALRVDVPEMFGGWVGRLEAASGVAVSSLRNFLDALKQRHDFFHSVGGRLSDHGLDRCYATPCTEKQAGEIFAKARSGHGADAGEHEQFASFLMMFFGRLDATRGWTKQLHLGALRNVNTRAMQELGADSGFDAVGDAPQAERLAKYLDALEREHCLPKTIVYNVNPTDNYALATIAGSFQEDSVPGKIQFGSAWWFLDTKDGMEAQLEALSNVGLLSRFVGMLTDSRSFMSFPRHEYFRRVLCNRIGRDVENGELPRDERLLGSMVRDICFENAFNYFGLAAPAASEVK